MDSYQHLPADLLFEILSRVPVKSLLRFRCVSKPWLALVDHDTNFARSHLETFKNNRNETRLFVKQIYSEYGTHSISYRDSTCALRRSNTFNLISKIPISFMNPPWDVVSSLHGLILLKSIIYRLGLFKNLKVWNPSIRKLQEIPDLLKREVLPNKPLFGVDIGLGYDIVANNYKLVKFIFSDNKLHSIAIFVLGADSWKIIDFQGGDDSCSEWGSFDGPVYFRGNLYLIVDHNDRVWDLVWFDLSKEVFSSVSMPPGCNRWTLALIDGGSSLVAFGDCSFGSVAWALDSESMCWTKTDLYVPGYHYRFFIKKNGDMLEWWSCDDFQNEVISYNLETEECKTLKIIDFNIGHVSPYVESLILHQ